MSNVLYSFVLLLNLLNVTFLFYECVMFDAMIQ